jgi:hypothetical protein
MAGKGKTESAGTGIAASQLAERSQLRIVREIVANPLAADDDLIVTTVDPNGIAVGGTFTLAVSRLRQPRRLTMTINDDDGGGGLSITARIVGYRNGVQVAETLTATAADTNDLTVTTAAYFEDIESITLAAKTADAGDDVTFGIDGSGFGLAHPIDRLEDVLAIWKIDNGTEGAVMPPSTTNIDVDNFALTDETLAATDIWEIVYLRSGSRDGFGTGGRF